MLHYHIIDLGKGIDLAKNNNHKECMICRYWFFNHGFNFQDYVCNGFLKQSFLFNIHKMVDSMDVYKYLNVSTGTVMKNPKVLELVSDHLKTKKLCKNAAKKLPYPLRYVPDKYKTQEMCDKAILENGGTLKYIPDGYKSQQMCNKTVDNDPHALKFVPECFKTQEICNKALNSYFFLFRSIPDQYKTQEMCIELFLMIIS